MAEVKVFVWLRMAIPGRKNFDQGPYILKFILRPLIVDNSADGCLCFFVATYLYTVNHLYVRHNSITHTH